MKLDELLAKFPTEESCKKYLAEKRWPNGVDCPLCGNTKVWHVTHRPFHWICKKCHKNGNRFSVISGTVFENTKQPLRTWFKVIFLMYNSKKDMSALQIQRILGIGSYETAWYMCHRVRAAMEDKEFLPLMGKVVEVDETYVGGKEKNKHKNKKTAGRGTVGKVPVIGAIARKGNVVCQVIESTDTGTLDRFVRKAVDTKVSLVATDEHSGYRLLDGDYNHKAVRHGQGEYVRGLVHTASIDSFWSLLKRGIMGSFHHVSKEYLPLYLAEFQFRHNNRKDPDMFGKIVAGC
jgi:transposase-like protein